MKLDPNIGDHTAIETIVAALTALEERLAALGAPAPAAELDLSDLTDRVADEIERRIAGNRRSPNQVDALAQAEEAGKLPKKDRRAT